jgi:hypothetical protein
MRESVISILSLLAMDFIASTISLMYLFDVYSVSSLVFGVPD